MDISNVLIDFMANNIQLAFLISIFINIIIAILGLVPSIFITVANIAIFGPLGGLIISIIGEALGSIISFYLYRRGFKQMSADLINKHTFTQKIMHTTGKEARRLIFAFRLLPYMPSGIVTYASAIGEVSIWDFALSSTLGKIPALMIEVLLSIGIVNALNLPLNQFLTIISVLLIIIILYQTLKK